MPGDVMSSCALTLVPAKPLTISFDDDTAHSSLTFVTKYFGVGHWGEFFGPARVRVTVHDMFAGFWSSTTNILIVTIVDKYWDYAVW